MGSFTYMAAVLIATVIICETANANNCPPPSKVVNRTPKCVQDLDCKDGKICCRNFFNGKSCVDRHGVNKPSSNPRNYNSNDSPWQDCDGVKCMPYEVCREDPHTRKLKCQSP